MYIYIYYNILRKRWDYLRMEWYLCVHRSSSYLQKLAGRPVRYKLTNNGLLVVLAYHYTTWGAQVIYKAYLRRLEEWGHQWESNSLPMVCRFSSQNRFTTWGSQDQCSICTLNGESKHRPFAFLQIVPLPELRTRICVFLILNPTLSSDVTYLRQQVPEKMRLTPKKWRVVFCLIGDSSRKRGKFFWALPLKFLCIAFYITGR